MLGSEWQQIKITIYLFAWLLKLNIYSQAILQNKYISIILNMFQMVEIIFLYYK